MKKEKFTDEIFYGLEYAIKEGDIEMFNHFEKRFCLKKKEWIRITLNTVFHCHSKEFLQYIFNSNPNLLSYRDKHKNTLLHYAASGGNLFSLQFLIENGLDIEAKNDRNATPLCLAAISFIRSFSRSVNGSVETAAFSFFIEFLRFRQSTSVL